MSEPVRVGILGCGNVGAALAGIIQRDARHVADRTGLALEVVRVAVRDEHKQRDCELAPGVLTTDAGSVVTSPDVDVVVELIGGIEPARSLIIDAMKAGKPVITGNKELLAHRGRELLDVADTAGVDLLFEAAVGGGIPLIRPLRYSLLGEKVQRVVGIVNGTTNYVLTRMTEDVIPYGEALAEAQRLGFAEADPTSDIEGYDAAAKAAILATVAFGTHVVAGDVYREGIGGVTGDDIAYAHRLGYVVKLLAVAERFDGEIGVRVHPAMVPMHHPLASVRESFNAVFVEGESVGELMLYGRGAGGAPTASAVLGDVIDAATNLRRGIHRPLVTGADARIRPIDELSTEYYLSIDVADQAGVLAAVAGALGDHGVSIRSMEQLGMAEEARLIFITHRARERAVQDTLATLRELPAVDRVNSVLRVVGDDES